MYRDKIQQPTVQTCRHRRAVHREGALEFATCALVHQIVGSKDDSCGRVPLAACEACCRSFPPSAEKMNPVVASFVLATALRVIDRGGMPGCDLERACALRESATNHLDDADTGGPLRPSNGTCTGKGVPLSLERLIPPPAPARDAGVRHWAVGVTTAPRRRATLERCLDSLAHAGWADPYLFVDATSVPPRYSQLPGTYRDPAIGAWPNYYLALCELLMRRPAAEAVMVVQDDSHFSEQENVRAYLEGMLWPGESLGLVSLYCSAAYTRPEPGWGILGEAWTWGALAFIFPRDLAKQFVTDHDVFEHRWNPEGSGLVGIDIVIGRWALRRRIPVWYPTPSLVQHIGETSALWSYASRAQGERRADRFADDETTDLPLAPSPA